jgi:2-succinyl-5-enolpyruvyl-6-hydroxy-3-cyclohexene-1-carboxylate synthase
MRRCRRGIVIGGPAQPFDGRTYSRAVAKISKILGWPVLADGLGPLRGHDSLNPGLVACYGAILRNSETARALHPDGVLLLGPYPASKVLREWLEPLDCRTWSLHAGAGNLDALHADTVALSTSVEAFADGMGGGRASKSAWFSAWMDAEAAACGRIERAMRRTLKSFEGRVAGILSKSLPVGTPVFVANSMPVRDVDFFWRPNDRGARIFFNRGANGIDGTLSTALGVARATGCAVLLTGDLALLHDLGGLLAAGKLSARAHLTIILLNNNGGGIFESLPVARLGAVSDDPGLDEIFEEFFATPQQVEFAKLFAAFGAEYHRLPDAASLRGFFHPNRKRLPTAGLRLLELMCDRKQDVDERRTVLASGGLP